MELRDVHSAISGEKQALCVKAIEPSPRIGGQHPELEWKLLSANLNLDL
jgi:hypothetical protein